MKVGSKEEDPILLEQQRRQQYIQTSDGQNPHIVPQPLHIQMHNQSEQLGMPQSVLDQDVNSSSLVYDRTIKVPKTGYADHGSHGVAALPYNVAKNGGQHMSNSTGGGVAGSVPNSSIQMQLQMQQMAAAMMQQQAQQQRQNSQQQQFQMMPPPSGGGNMINTTSSTGLMQALNAQMAANQQAIHNLTNAAANQQAMNNLAHAVAAGTVDQNGNPIGEGNDNMAQHQQISNLSTMSKHFNNNGGQGTGGDGGGGIMHSPGETRNGKKRVSPSLPLHPSQLQMHHGNGGVGGLLAASNSNLGMNAVVEDECSSNYQLADQILLQQQQNLYQSQQGMNSSSIDNHVVVQQQGLLDAALLGQGTLPQKPSGLSAVMSGQEQLQQQQLDHQQVENTSLPPPSSQKQEDVHREVLTNPSVPSANSGLDNAEGNLIVHRGDILRIPRKNMHLHPPEASSGGSSKKKAASTHESAEGDEFVNYKVVSLLGQGTFAQVFHCIEQKSNKCVAVKIVKNKPAYTRQAAVEIDVFRKLNSSNSKDDGGTSRSENSEEADTDEGGGSGSGDNHADKSTTKGSSATSFTSFSSFDSASTSPTSDSAIIRLMCYFMHSSHLCLVFEMLGPNLYEMLKKRQFRGLPIGAVRALVRQATEGIKLLGRRNVVHCDLKPENILMVRNDVETVIAECKAKGDTQTSIPPDKSTGVPVSPSPAEGKDDDDEEEQWIKLIDFGSACFEGQTTHTYIQSRFYRSPEVLIGLPYDSAIDIWSLGCVAAELFLGLPILPGVHEHDQLGRVLEMIGPVPDWMLEQGSKSSKFFKNTPPSNSRSHVNADNANSSLESRHSWKFKSRQEYIDCLTEEEKRSKGGIAKLEQQQTNRYFKKKKLEDIVMHHGVCNTKKEREQLGLFVHFLKGVLDPDPWKRWTAHQASMHPFLTGSTVYRIKSSGTGDVGADGTKSGVRPYDIHWVPPWDASISRRKLMVIQKTKEKMTAQQQQPSRRRLSHSESLRVPISQSVPEASAVIPNMQASQFSTQGLDIYGSPLKIPHKLEPPSPAISITSQMAAMADAMSLERARSNISGKASPPQSLFNNGGQMMYPHPAVLSASLGGVGMPLSYQQMADAPSNLGRSYSENLHPAVHIAAQQQLQNEIAFLQQQLPPPPTFMGAQSFSGAYGGYLQGFPGMPNTHHPYVESELGYALQRPGVVPGMGSDAFNMALRRQSSNSSLLAQQSQMLSASLSNLSSTPQNYNVPGPFQVPMSPGGLLLQQLGLQEQMLNNHASYNVRAGGGIGASLLSQQLGDNPTQPNQQQDQQQQQQQMSNTNSLGRQQSFPSNPGMVHPGSYHGGYNNEAVSYLQSASFSEFGGGNGMRQQQNLSQIHPQLRTNVSFPAAMPQDNNGQDHNNNNEGQTNHRQRQHRRTMG